MTKCVYRTMLPVLGALALWGAAPAIAQANVGWRLNGSPLTGSIATSYKGTMKLSDPGLFSLGAECEDATEGSSTFGGVGEITQWTASKCVSIGVCEKSTSTIEPLNLPWHSELVSVGGSIHVVLVSGGKGTPGYKLRCKAFGDYVEDKCTGNLEMATTNGESGMSATFDGGKLKCNETESKGGTLEGSQKITASAGGKLSAEATEAETPPRWLVGGHSLESSMTTAWNGSIELSDRITGFTNPVGVVCADTGKGKVGAEAAGEMTAWTMSECRPSSGSSCESATAIEAVGLPWHTELAVVEGQVRDVLSATKGTLGYTLKCKALGSTISDECLAVPGPSVTNAGTDVTLAFANTRRFDCKLGLADAGQMAGSQTMKLLESPESLEAF